MSTSLAKSLRRRIREFDVVHVHSLYLWHGLVASVLGRQFSVPYVIRPHGTLDPYHAAQHRVRKAVYWRLVEKRNFAGAAGIHFTSVSEAEHARVAGLKARAFVVPLGVDVHAFEHPDDSMPLEERWPELAGKTLVTFVGRLTPKKGLDLLLPAFASAVSSRPDAHLVVAGPDDEGLGSAIRRQVSDLGLGRHVTLLPMVDEREKVALLRRSACFALPSADENFALGAVEAMAAGVPVVLTNHVAIHAEIADAEAGIVVERSAPALTEGLARLLQDTREAARLGVNARELARSRYSWSRIGLDLERMYTEVMSGPPTGRESELTPK